MQAARLAFDAARRACLLAVAWGLMYDKIFHSGVTAR
jgi:hypothetical protein